MIIKWFKQNPPNERNSMAELLGRKQDEDIFKEWRNLGELMAVGRVLGEGVHVHPRGGLGELQALLQELWKLSSS